MISGLEPSWTALVARVVATAKINPQCSQILEEGGQNERLITVDHTTLFRWIQAYAPELEKRIRPHLRTCNGSWRVDETYVKVKGRWTYLYRAVDSRGQTIDFLLSAKRDAAAAKRF